MIKEFFYNLLKKKLAKEKHEYIKLQWEQAKLEQQLKELKESRVEQ